MAEEIPTDTPIEQEVIETPQADIVETEPVSDGGRTNLQNLYEALKSDNVFSEYVPQDGFDSFVKAYKDPKDIANLYNALKDDSVFSEYMPPTLMGAVEYFGLGKPSAVPSASVGGGSATKERGVEQPSTLQPREASEASLDNIERTMKVYADGQGAFPETLSAADVKELRKQVPGGELPNVSDEKVAKMLAGKSPKQVRIASINAIPDIKERKTEQARMYKDFSREKSIENQQIDQNITALNQGLQQIKAEGENLQQQLQNPNIDPQTASMLSESLQQTQANYNQAVNDYNDQLNKYQQNARFIKTMGAGVQSSLKGMLPSSMWQPRNPLDVGVAAAWNSTAPPLLKTLGAVIESYPAIAFGEDTENTHSPVADAIFKLADMAEVNVGKYSPKANISLMDDVNVYNTSQLLGNLLGSVAMTFGGGAAAGTIGAQAAGFSQVYGDVYKQGRDAGLTQAEAMYFAMPTGIVAAYLGDKGVESLAGAFTKTSLKSAIKQGAKELAEKRTPQMMMEFGQKVLTNTLKGAVKEGLQEGSEFVTEFGSKKGASLKEGVKFQDDLSLKGFGKGLAESAITGAAGGGLLGPFFGAGRNSAFSDVVTKASRDPQAEADFLQQVDASVAAKDITPEQKQQMVEMLEKTKQAAATVPPVVESEPARAEATALVLEQQDLQEQIEQTNPAMAKPLQDRLDEVNNRLGEIAEGKNLPTEPTEEAVSEEAQAEAPQTLPEVTNVIATLRDMEQAEYADIDPNDEAKRQQIYDRYDEIITPLLEQEKELKAQAPVAEESKGEAESSPLQAAKESISKRVQGDKLLDAQDLVDELSDNKAEIDNDGMVTVYHRTTPENKKEIESTGKMKGLEDGVFFSTKETGQNEGYGDSIVKLKVPIESIEIDDTFGDEAHVRIPTKKAGQIIDVKEYLPSLTTEASPTSEQAPQSFPAQEGAESVEDKFQANSELEQIYRELQEAVNKNIDEQTLRILKANPSEAMIKKAFDILQSKGVIKIDCK